MECMAEIDRKAPWQLDKEVFKTKKRTESICLRFYNSASLQMMCRDVLTNDERKTIKPTDRTYTVQTSSGVVQAQQEAQVDDSLAVLPYSWEIGEHPQLTRNGVTIECCSDNCVLQCCCDEAFGSSCWRRYFVESWRRLNTLVVTAFYRGTH